jgi:hypothetical protein
MGMMRTIRQSESFGGGELKNVELKQAPWYKVPWVSGDQRREEAEVPPPEAAQLERLD